MNSWLETYPHKVYASVLLLDGKVVDYKIGKNYWKSPFYVSLRGQITLDELKRCKTKYRFWEVNSDKEHNEVFNTLGKAWIESQSK